MQFSISIDVEPRSRRAVTLLDDGPMYCKNSEQAMGRRPLSSTLPWLHFSSGLQGPALASLSDVESCS